MLGLVQLIKTHHNLTVALLDTGARFSEIASLNWQDINLNEKLIHLKVMFCYRKLSRLDFKFTAHCESLLNAMKQVVDEPTTDKALGKLTKLAYFNYLDIL